MAHRHAVALDGLLCFLLAITPTWSWGQVPERVGTVLVVEGHAEVQNPGQSLWELLHFRDGIGLDDTVRTAMESRTKVLLRDDVIIAIAEQSELQFTQLFITRQQRRTVAGLRSGMIRVVSGRPPGSDTTIAIQTANALISATNTAFLVRFLPPDTTEVFGLLGVVSVRNLSPVAPTVIDIEPNFHTRVIGESPPAPPVEVPAATREALNRQVRVIEQLPREALAGSELSEGEKQTLGSMLPPVFPEVQQNVSSTMVTPQLESVTPDTMFRVPRVNLQVTFPGR